jgi:uncharacterized membrane protein YciS (DUF1049 family)
VTPTQLLGVAVLLAVLIPIVLLVSAFYWLRQKVRCWRVGRMLHESEDGAYHAYRRSR